MYSDILVNNTPVASISQSLLMDRLLGGVPAGPGKHPSIHRTVGDSPRDSGGCQLLCGSLPLLILYPSLSFLSCFPQRGAGDRGVKPSQRKHATGTKTLLFSRPLPDGCSVLELQVSREETHPLDAGLSSRLKPTVSFSPSSPTIRSGAEGRGVERGTALATGALSETKCSVSAFEAFRSRFEDNC